MGLVRGRSVMKHEPFLGSLISVKRAAETHTYSSWTSSNGHGTRVTSLAYLRCAIDNITHGNTRHRRDALLSPRYTRFLTVRSSRPHERNCSHTCLCTLHVTWRVEVVTILFLLRSGEKKDNNRSGIFAIVISFITVYPDLSHPHTPPSVIISKG